MHGIHAATSRVEDSAQGLSWQLRFDHAVTYKLLEACTLHRNVHMMNSTSYYTLSKITAVKVIMTSVLGSNLIYNFTTATGGALH